MQIELFEHDNLGEAEYAVNQWLKKYSEKEIVKIDMQSRSESSSHNSEIIIMIVYKNPETS